MKNAPKLDSWGTNTRNLLKKLPVITTALAVIAVGLVWWFSVEQSQPEYDYPKKLENPKLMHTFFIADSLPDKVVVALKSALRLNVDATITLWTEDHRTSDTTQKLAGVMKDFRCASRATLRVRGLGDLEKKLSESKNPVVNSNMCKELTHRTGAVASSDLFRFLVLFFFGGIYFDADTVFLKDMAVWHELASYGFAFKWGGEGPIPKSSGFTNDFNTAIMGLPIGSKVVSAVINAVGRCDAAAFYPTDVSRHLGCADRDVFCDGLVMVPTGIFDPLHEPNNMEKWKSQESFGAWQKNGDGTFLKQNPFGQDLHHFFPSAFAFHWHNRWILPFVDDSVWAALVAANSQCETLSAKSTSQITVEGFESTPGTVMEPQDAPGLVNGGDSGCPPAMGTEYVLPTANRTMRKVYIDFGGFKGDTLALYGLYFLEDDSFPEEVGLQSFAKEAYVIEADDSNIKVILEKFKGIFSGDTMSRPGDDLLFQMKGYVRIIQGVASNVDAIVHFEPSATGNAGQVSDGGKLGVLAYDAGPWFHKWVKPTDQDIIVLKIDIEGSEIDVIESFDRVGAFNFVDHVVIEWHDWIMPKVHEAKPRLEAILAKYGLKYKWATLDATLWKQYGSRDTWPVNHCDAHYFRDEDSRWNFRQKH